MIPAGITFQRNKSYVGAKSFPLPCGQCIGCRLDRSRDWATRLTHEAQLHKENCFLTLTYDDVHYPGHGSVDVEVVQRFMKRLRKKVGPVRFFACGEYGENNHRPHYHILVFGHAFLADRHLWRTTQGGFPVYRSATLEKLWPMGYSEIGTVTVKSAGYVARYITKKITGEASEAHYTVDHPYTGEEVRIKPEFITMSNRPGIGKGWYDKYSKDAFPSDFLVIEGKKVPVPRYYKKQLAEEEAFLVTAKRKEAGHKRKDNNTPERLAIREELQHLRAERLKRNLEQ